MAGETWTIYDRLAGDSVLNYLWVYFFFALQQQVHIGNSLPGLGRIRHMLWRGSCFISIGNDVLGWCRRFWFFCDHGCGFCFNAVLCGMSKPGYGAAFSAKRNPFCTHLLLELCCTCCMVIFAPLWSLGAQQKCNTSICVKFKFPTSNPLRTS